MTIPLLDHLTTEIQRRFDHGSISVYSGLVIIPSKMMSLVYKNVNWREKFCLFADLFNNDFPCPKHWRQNWTCGEHIGWKVKTLSR